MATGKQRRAVAAMGEGELRSHTLWMLALVALAAQAVCALGYLHRRQELAGMQTIGQPVDDRHARIRCKFLEHGVRVVTDHDRIAHVVDFA